MVSPTPLSQYTMPTTKNALLRYQILDRCFSDFHHKYFIEGFVDCAKKSNIYY